MPANTTSTRSGTKEPLLQQGIVLNGKWEILQHLATGGKGDVYRAHQATLNREVVVKTVSVEYLAEYEDHPEEVDTELQRFHREALAMAQIRHPYVAQVYDHDTAVVEKQGEEVTVHYVVLEYVPGGRTLRHTMPHDGYKNRERDLRQWMRTYFLPMFDGLETVHALGIVHRDMKPENVLLDGLTPKIIDFGIAGGPVWSQLTKSHHVEGTITYMAPEQFMDLGETDARADVYALGKMLYEAVQGRMRDSRTACPLKGVCLPNPSTPFMRELDTIIQEATAEDLEKRTPSVKALREALERVLAKAEAAEKPLLKGLQQKQWIAIAGVLTVIVVASNIYHHFIMSHSSPMPSGIAVQEGRHAADAEKGPVHADVPPARQAPVPTLEAKDGTIMRLVPSGQVRLPSYVGAEGDLLVEVAPFYMDETEVTNYKYVEFLNQVLSKVEVKDGIVRGAGRPWLLLGPVYGGYEPIVFLNGRFSLQDAAGASRPVVKVTGYGASAYAAFYGKRLPTEREWLRAVNRTRDSLTKRLERGGEPAQRSLEEETGRRGGPLGQEPGQVEVEPEESGSAVVKGGEVPALGEDSGPSAVPHPVLDFPPNVDGIRGLMRNVSEWGVRLQRSPNAQPQFVVTGGVRGTMMAGSTPFPGIAQDPAMAFEDLGFRCVRGIEEGATK
ncbi:MAG: bifunctional serine/threonine-protein kinase/formylglycine-generating enzyme family protein [Thermodesulfobacteriota bacterium]